MFMKNQYITVFVNGEPFNCINHIPLQDIILCLNIDLRLVLLEYNNEILPDIQIANVLMSQNDKLEILTIVGGG